MANGNSVQTEEPLTLIVEFDQRATVSTEDSLRGAIEIKEANEHTRQSILEATAAQGTIAAVEEVLSLQGWIQIAQVLRPDQVLRAKVHIHGTTLSPLQVAHQDVFGNGQIPVTNLGRTNQVTAAQTWLKENLLRKLLIGGRISPNDRVDFKA